MAGSKDSRSNDAIPICGVGASAGGVSALKDFFAALPADLGLAFVVVMHLPDDQSSMLDEIVARATDMTVRQVDDQLRFEPDTVYVIAPDRELVIEDGTLSAHPHSAERGKRAPIDVFFRSIADMGEDAIAVVLSGAGADGSVGVRAVKEAGGLVLVQDPDEAEFPSMPQNAASVGGADLVAPAARLADRLAEIVRNKPAIDGIGDGADDALRRIVATLGARSSHDFSGYKRATVLRRVRRRMHVRGVTTLADYADLLKQDPDEGGELFSDLLISVTQFFRDPGAFEALTEEVIGPLMAEASEDGVRAWVVGCATGEEVYSLAMLFLEQFGETTQRVPIQIFATDLDEGALKVARAGRYPRSIEADVSQARLDRFFVKENAHYRVRKEVRDIVLFAPHSVLKDPPFVRLDLISCRNLLIYMERHLQKKLCALFHYGLKPGGSLFLGSAETCDSAPDLLSATNREARIYRAKANTRSALPILSQVSNGFDRLHDDAPDRRSPRLQGASPSGLHAGALEDAAPPSVLVDDDHHIIHLSPSAGRFLMQSGGPFSGKIGEAVRSELRVDIKHAVDRALETGAPTITPPVAVAFNGQKNRVSVHVSSVPADAERGHNVLVVFLDGGPVEDDEEAEDASQEDRPDVMRRLQAELKAANEALGASRSDHEASVQDLRAANEELQSINEEYRSTSEELETSKEELQSMNEELQTVNSELKNKLESISSAHNDLRNLTAATEIGTLFLDANMRIRMFTPPVADLFNIEDTDVGRALTDFTHQLDYDGLERDVKDVRRDLTPKEAEIRTRDGRWFMMRVRPYRTMEDKIEGVVISFVDISKRREMELRVKQSEARYRKLYEAMDQGYCVIELIRNDDGAVKDFIYLDTNPALKRQVGLHNLDGAHNSELEYPLGSDWLDLFETVSRGGESRRVEGQAGGKRRHYEVFASPHGEGRDHIAVLFADITERMADAAHKELLTQELSHRVKNTLAVVQSMAAMTVRSSENNVDFRQRFLGRLQALGMAHDLLFESNWNHARIDTLLAGALAPYRSPASDRLTMQGPDIALTPRQGLGVAMILHELATNAAKYGALTAEHGRVTVRWSHKTTARGAQLSLDWIERDGPAVIEPDAKGFGSRLITSVARDDLGGEISLDFAKTGLEGHLNFPYAEPLDAPDGAPAQAG